MKKILLPLILLFSLFINAQEFWTPVSLFPEQAFAPINISVVNAQMIWIGGFSYGQTGNNSTKCYRTTDGGTTWTEGTINLGNENLYINSLCAISETTAYVSANSNSTTVSGGVWVTHDSGNSWTRQSPDFGLNSFVDFDNFKGDNFVHFYDANNGTVVSNPENDHFVIYTTLDTGNHWSRVSDANLPAALPGEKGYMIKHGFVESRVWFGTTKGRIFKSNDKGIHWTVSQMPPMTPFGQQNDFSAVAFKNDNEGILVTDSWSRYTTTDNGNYWNYSIPNYDAIQNYQLLFVPETDHTYFSYGEEILVAERASSYTTNNGLIWTQLNDTEENPVDVLNARFVNSAVGFCIGYYHFTNPESGMYFYKLGDDAFGLLKTDDQVLENKFAAAPNPATDMVKIYGKNIKSIAVFDVSGKKVLTKNCGISDDISLDISELQNGIYLAEIINNSEVTSTIKIVKK